MLLQVDEDIGHIAIGDDHLDAGISDILCGLQLGNHAASAMATFLVAHILAHPTIGLLKKAFSFFNNHSKLYSECKSIKKNLEKRRIIENNKVFLHRETF